MSRKNDKFKNPPFSDLPAISLDVRARYQPVLDYARSATKRTNSIDDIIKSLTQGVIKVASYTEEERARPDLVKDTKDMVRSWNRTRIGTMYRDIATGSTSAYLKQVKSYFKKGFEDVPKDTLYRFFDAIDAMDASEHLALQITNQQTLVPRSVQTEFKKWLISKDAQTLAAKDEPSPEPLIKVIELDTLLPPGEMESDDNVSFKRDMPEEPFELRLQPRMKWLKDFLKESGVPVNSITHYHQKNSTFANEKVPYDVIDVDYAHRRYQIAVADYVGYATYIIRDAKDFTPGKETPDVTIADLKMDKSVYQISCYSQEQWLRSIRHYTETPQEQLQEQLKTRIYWGHRKAEVEQSFAALYAETNRLPSTTDDTIIEHGPLAGKTTIRRLYAALSHCAISGLSHIRNFPALRDHVENLGVPDPAVQKPYVVPTVDFDIAEVFHKVSDDILRNALPSDPALDKAFTERRVKGLEKLDLPDTETIRSTADFMEAAGLAGRDDNGVVSLLPEKTVRRVIHLTKLQLGL